MRIGILGTGTISSAVVAGIAGDGHRITVSRRNLARSTALAAQFPNVAVAENQAVLDQSDLVLIGLMPEVARATLPGLNFHADHIVASFMADIPLSEVAQMTFPARVEAVVIPFPAIASGGSPVLVCPPSETIAQVFGANNHIIEIKDELDLTSYMAAQALMSPVVKQLVETVDWMALRTGDPDGAERFLRILIGGALTAAPFDRPGALTGLLQDLNTKGGLNATLREHFGQNGVYDQLRNGLDQLEKRLKG